MVKNVHASPTPVSMHVSSETNTSKKKDELKQQYTVNEENQSHQEIYLLLRRKMSSYRIKKKKMQGKIFKFHYEKKGALKVNEQDNKSI